MFSYLKNIDRVGVMMVYIQQPKLLSSFNQLTFLVSLQRFGKPFGMLPICRRLIFLVWLLLKNKSLTGENLLKRGFFGPFYYCFCKLSLEIADHLLVDCIFSRKFWAMVLNSVQLTLPLQNSVKDIYLAWHEWRPSKNSVAVIHKFLHSILKFTRFSLWLSRNNCVFNNRWPIFSF